MRTRTSTIIACAFGAALATACGGGDREPGAGSGGPAGSAAGSGARADCESIDEAVVEALIPGDLRQQLGATRGPELSERLKAALIAVCQADAWTAVALDCAARPSPAARTRCKGTLTPAQERNAQNALVTEAMTALAEPLYSQSPAVQTGPHPDFPTAALAGTDKLFTMIDPERGPKAPIAMALPRTGLVWTIHAYCDADATGPVCTPPVMAAPGLWGWRVGRRGKELIVAESQRATRVDKTFVWTLRADGTPVHRVRFDAYDRVESALLFKAGDRYSGRKRNGANALEGCGYMSYKLDAAGRTEELACLQWTGEPMLDTDGVAKTKLVRDAAGFLIEELRFDVAGKAAPNADGVHRTLVERGPDGRAKVERYRDPAGKPVLSTNGCYGRRTERDVQGSVVKLVCLDAADQPTGHPTSGASSEVYRVDAAGCRTGVRYQTAAGLAGANNDLVSALDFEVDERCAVTSSACMGVNGRPKACSGGAPAKYVSRFDAAGNTISVKHYGPIGTPARDPAFHAFELRRTFDGLGNQLSQACYSETGGKVVCPNTDFHVMRSKYDDAARETQQKYYDASDQATDNYGSYKRTYKHDNYDHLVESQNHDEAGALTEAFGVAIRKDLFDTAHRRFGVVLYDRAGQPSSNTGCYTGGTCPTAPWHAVRIIRRKDGSVEKNLFFDATKRLIDTKYCGATPCFD